MYTSKYYTCEQIDQRLLQGYYDDAVAHGFTGNIADFWVLVLSISKVKGDFDKKIETLLQEFGSFHGQYGAAVAELQSKVQAVENVIRSNNALNEALANKIESLRGDLTAEIGRSTNADMNIMNMFGNVNTQLAKIQPLTEEEVSTLVNDALES